MSHTAATVRTRRAVGVLLAVSCANLVVAALHFGLAAAAPLLRELFALDARELGLLLAAPPLGLMLGTFAWGELADRIGDRIVLTGAFVGFAVASALGAMAAARLDVLGYAVLLLLAGACGSAAHSAGGRAISAAFAPERQGLVLAIRHTSIPVGAAAGGIGVPAMVAGSGLASATALGAALGAVVAGMLAAVLPRAARASGGPHAPGAAEVRGPAPFRVPSLLLLAVGAACLAFTQLGIGSFLTVLLVDEVGMGIAAAAMVFTTAQLLGAAGRIVLGAWSDRVRSRVSILRGVALVTGSLVVVAAVAGSSSVEALALTAALVVVTSCNGVVVATAASLAPRGRTGATLGMQTTFNAAACTAAPILLGVVLAAAGWQAFELVLVGVVCAGGSCLAALRR